MAYTPLATIVPKGNRPLYEIASEINEDIDQTDYLILNDVGEQELRIVRDDGDSGVWEVEATFECYPEGTGDEFEASDPIANNHDHEYRVVEKPMGERMLVWIEE